MSNIDFYKDEELVTAEIFGLCDDPDENTKTPAYVSIDAADKFHWGTNVTNKSSKNIYFIAVDNKIEILRDNGEMENRCDAMLHNDDNIIFVELKDRSDKTDWIKYAVENQLLTTINVFKDNYDISKFKHRVAYACNRRHPHFVVSSKEYMQKFWKKNKVRLVISNNITIK